jgi:5,10-methylenetetrahydromethanopterin reductase
MSLGGSVPPRLGITYLPAFPAEGITAAAQAAEHAALDEFWLWEDVFSHGGVTTTAVALAATDRIRVGIGLLPVPLRNVVTTAAELASLCRIFPDRLIAGIGHGLQAWMRQVGASVDSPLTLLTEYQQVLRILLDGGDVDFTGRYLALEGVKLRWAPAAHVPIMIGGDGPKTVRLSARLGDGTILTAALSDAETRSHIGIVRTELREAGQDPTTHPVFAILLAATGHGAEERLRDERGRWGKAGTAQIGVAGNARAIADKVAALGRMGVTSVAVQPTTDEPDIHGLIRLLGEEVKPLLFDMHAAGV